MKKLRILLTLMLVSVCSWQAVWADDVVANVTLKEKNSLSTEILAISGINDLTTVTHLTVTTNSGVQLGEEDWTTMRSLTALVNLDLSNASADAVPESQFSNYCPNLVTVSLPKDLTAIGSSAFHYQQNLVTVNVPNTVTTIGSSAFNMCQKLENCDLSSCGITVIPSFCFYHCNKLLSFTIPSSVTEIGQLAFGDCELFTSPLPSGLIKIGPSAFEDADMSGVDVVLQEGAEIGYNSFYGTNISTIELPSTYYSYNSDFDYCPNLTHVTLKSPTVVSASSDPNSSYSSNITLQVPSHLIAAYKSHTRWSKFKDAVAISPAVTDYTVSTDLNLSNSSIRMEGSPSVFFTKDASLTIYGSAAQAFNNFTGSAEAYYYSSSHNKYTMVFNESADVTVSGDYVQRIYIDDYSQRWYFLCMPFDFTVGDVAVESGSFVIRTYDGARRNTENTNTGNWTANLANDVEIKAGTGFILQTSEQTWVTFKAKSNGTNHAFKKNSDVIQIALAANNTNGEASAANTGWNMVGNPWQTYYNIHNMNYTAPFAVYENGSYQTYSPEDDDFALEPFKAIFVQCPTGVSKIEFPANGRQLTSTVTSANPSRTRTAKGRQLLDIQIANGELKDKTRLVLNENATMDYEIGRDASKFFSDGSSTPQIYSLGADATQYAINERPAGNGSLQLGILFAADGEYTISAIRNEIGQVILTDHETGIQTDLQQKGYSFEAKKGTCEGRFSINTRGTTGIQIVTETDDVDAEVFTLDGQKVGDSTNGLRKGVYVIRQGQKARKVIVK